MIRDLPRIWRCSLGCHQGIVLQCKAVGAHLFNSLCVNPPSDLLSSVREYFRRMIFSNEMETIHAKIDKVVVFLAFDVTLIMDCICVEKSPFMQTISVFTLILMLNFGKYRNSSSVRRKPPFNIHFERVIGNYCTISFLNF